MRHETMIHISTKNPDMTIPDNMRTAFYARDGCMSGWRFMRLDPLGSKPEKSRPVTIETPAGKITISTEFKTSVKGKIPSLPNDYNNQFVITVKTTAGSETFDYGISVNDTREGKTVLAEKDQIGALYCFIGDAIAGLGSFEEFQSEFGYSDCREGYRIWKACRESTVKAVRLGIADLYRLQEFIREKYPDVV